MAFLLVPVGGRNFLDGLDQFPGSDAIFARVGR